MVLAFTTRLSGKPKILYKKIQYVVFVDALLGLAYLLGILLLLCSTIFACFGPWEAMFLFTAKPPMESCGVKLFFFMKTKAFCNAALSGSCFDSCIWL
jgi:hypothetical protein